MWTKKELSCEAIVKLVKFHIKLPSFSSVKEFKPFSKHFIIFHIDV